jgi:hypothetical protein
MHASRNSLKRFLAILRRSKATAGGDLGRFDSRGPHSWLSKASRIPSVRACSVHGNSCPPVLLRPNPTKHCLERNRRIVELLGAVAPDVVLLHAIWDVNDRAEDLRPTVTAIKKQHPATRIIILGPVPVWQGGLPNAVAAHFWRTGKTLPERAPFYFDRASGDAVLRKIAAELDVEYISARDVFCNRDGCIDRIGDSLVASDIVHLTGIGSAFLAEAILDNMRSAH